MVGAVQPGHSVWRVPPAEGGVHTDTQIGRSMTRPLCVAGPSQGGGDIN